MSSSDNGGSSNGGVMRIFLAGAAALAIGWGFALLAPGSNASAQSTWIVAQQGKGSNMDAGYGPWWVGGPDGGAVIIQTIDGGTVYTVAQNPCRQSPLSGGFSQGGDAGANTVVVVAQNDGGANYAYACNLTVNTPNPGGVEIICGPSANACATDGGAGSTQNVLGNYYFSGPGISNNGSPFAYVCPKAGDSMCVFQDGGIGWDSLPGFGP